MNVTPVDCFNAMRRSRAGWCVTTVKVVELTTFGLTNQLTNEPVTIVIDLNDQRTKDVVE
ncbi:hypothetical protein D3C81_2265360 [compost metagenome]